MKLILEFHQGYPLPNQNPRYLDQVIEFAQFHPRKPSILCIGGVFYAHYLKAKYPESFVEAIDYNDVSITGQSLCGLNNIYKVNQDYLKLIQLGLPVKNYNSSLIERSYLKRLYERLLIKKEIKDSKKSLFLLFARYSKPHPWLTEENIEKYIHKIQTELTRPTSGDPELIEGLKVQVPDKISSQDVLNFKSDRKYNLISTNNVLEHIYENYGETKLKAVFNKLLNSLENGGVIEVVANTEKINLQEFIIYLTGGITNVVFIDNKSNISETFSNGTFSTITKTQSNKYYANMDVVVMKKV